MDGAIALAVLVVDIALVTVPAPGPSDGRAAAMFATGALAAVTVLFRRRFPLWLLAAATLDGVVDWQVSAALPFAGYALTRYGPTSRIR